MATSRYFEAMLQVPAGECPDDMTVAHRPFAIERHGGMVLLRLGPVAFPGQEGETYSALVATAEVKAIIGTLEVILANMGR